ncbi:MAG: hypothetical protein CMI54_06420 [Parcubacteria group bacterium]|nr:hypothetical protein [Parcubacteria group bacterium]|tara:strand:+ start:225 stop:659 length:435 start_codon:yes stop_codon:yes gene_type:complete
MTEEAGTQKLPFYERPYTPIDRMTEEERAEELNLWRNLFTWLDPEVMYYLSRVGELCRVSTRSGQTYFGTLGACKYEPLQIVLRVEDRQFDWSTQLAVYEIKDVSVKVSDVINYQFINERNEVLEPQNNNDGAGVESALEEIEF